MGRINVEVNNEILKEVEYKISVNKAKNRSEFIEKALNFYLAHLDSKRDSEYLNDSVAEGVRRGILEIEKQTMPNIFGLSVELSMLTNILASGLELSENELNRLRKDCVEGVKETKKRTNLQNAVRYQNDHLTWTHFASQRMTLLLQKIVSSFKLVGQGSALFGGFGDRKIIKIVVILY